MKQEAEKAAEASNGILSGEPLKNLQSATERLSTAVNNAREA
jgi:hypothetical protein